MATTSKPLFERLLDVVRGAVVGGLMLATVVADPKPASRPRIARWGGGVFYAKGYTEFYGACQQQLSKLKADMLAGEIAVLLEFVIPRAKSSKLAIPRGDVDNYAKGPLDAMTKVEKVWRDDTQVGTLVVTKRFAAPGEAGCVRIHYGSLQPK